MLWILSESTSNEARVREMTATVNLFLPKPRMQEVDANAYSISAEEVLFVMWTAEHLALGQLEHALSMLQVKLLPRAANRNDHWLAALRLWCALCNVYLCRGAAALEHIAVAEQADVATSMQTEYALAKGLALRLQREFEQAEQCLRAVGVGISAFPDVRLQASSALAETLLASGSSEYAVANIEVITQKANANRWCCGAVVGIALAAMYRYCTALGEVLPDGKDQSDVLADMDNAPAFLRPFLTTLLEDILPRPLEGVVANNET